MDAETEAFWTGLEAESADTFYLEAKTKNSIEGEVLDRFVDPEEKEILIPYRGPSDSVYSMYTLTLDIGEQVAYHAFGPPQDQQARGVVTKFEWTDN